MSRQRPFRLLAWLPWALAAILTATSAWLCQRYLGSRAEVARLRGGETLAAFETRTARNQLLAERLISNRQLTDQSTVITTQAQQIAALSDALQTGADPTRFQTVPFASPNESGAEAQAVAVWNPATLQGLLQVAKLPPLAASQDYQLWVIDSEHSVPVEGGVFSVDPATGGARVAFHLRQPLRTAAKFALSRERKGGGPQPEGPILLLSR